MAIARHELKAFLNERGISKPTLSDARYSLPSVRFVSVPFARGLASFLAGIGFVGYAPDALDCDDYAAAASLYMRALHVRSNLRTGIGFGEFRFHREAGAHALCAFVSRREHGGLSLGFFEPQDKKIVSLTRAEIESCSALYL